MEEYGRLAAVEPYPDLTPKVLQLPLPATNIERQLGHPSFPKPTPATPPYPTYEEPFQPNLDQTPTNVVVVERPRPRDVVIVEQPVMVEHRPIMMQGPEVRLTGQVDGKAKNKYRKDDIRQGHRHLRNGQGRHFQHYRSRRSAERDDRDYYHEGNAWKQGRHFQDFNRRQFPDHHDNKRRYRSPPPPRSNLRFRKLSLFRS